MSHLRLRGDCRDRGAGHRVAATGGRDGRAGYRRPDLRAARGAHSGEAPDRFDGLSPRAGQGVGAGRLADLALPSPRRRAVAGRPAAHRRGRSLLLRRVQRLDPRFGVAAVPRGPGVGGAGGFGDVPGPFQRVLSRATLRRDLSRARPPPTHLGAACPGPSGRPIPRRLAWSEAARSGSSDGCAASSWLSQPTPRRPSAPASAAPSGASPPIPTPRSTSC